MGYIYKVTNKINNKLYIGKTIKTIEQRWHEHCWQAQNSAGSYFLLHKAILKYGQENFLLEPIWEGPNEELDAKEKQYILQYDSYFTHNKGYNMTYGGEGTVRYNDDEITALWNQGYRNYEIAEILNANPNTISIRIQALFGQGAGTQRKGECSRKPVLQYSIYGDLIKEWTCGQEAEIALNMSRGSVSRCCTKQRVIADGYFWKFTTDDTPIEELMVQYAKSPKCCQVNLIDDEGNIIKVYKSGKEAEQELGITHGKVSEICNHKYGRKTAKGYKFEWAYPIKRILYKS